MKKLRELIAKVSRIHRLLKKKLQMRRERRRIPGWMKECSVSLLMKLSDGDGWERVPREYKGHTYDRRHASLELEDRLHSMNLCFRWDNLLPEDDQEELRDWGLEAG